jgi:2-polyprenyl-3-methyl-5-hydroxy-6-metoxy-1,4-benzoquinol methylase
MTDTQCVICGGSGFRPVLLGINADHPRTSRIPVLECTSCGLSVSDRSAIAAAPGELYFEGYYGERSRMKAGVLVRLFQRERRFHALRGLRPGRILDVGCGDGTFLEHLPQQWMRAGYEPSESGRKQLAEKGIGTVELYQAGEGFDVITLWQSFEHVEDPIALLDAMRARIRPGGCAFFSVPNFASLQARTFGSRWFHLDPTRHLFHYRPGQLRALLERSGWRVERCTTFSLEYGVFGWWQSLFNLLPLEFNKGYKLLKARKKFDRSARTVIEFGVYALLAVPVAAVAGVFMLIESALASGGVIQLKARPRPA